MCHWYVSMPTCAFSPQTEVFIAMASERKITTRNSFVEHDEVLDLYKNSKNPLTNAKMCFTDKI